MKLLRKIFCHSFFILSVLLLIYTFYKSEIIFGGEKRNYYYTYYVICLILVFISFFSFNLNEKLKDYFIISCVSIFLGLYLFEGYLSFLKFQGKQQIYLKKEIYKNKTGKNYDTRTIFELYDDYLRNDNRITVKVPSYTYIKKKSKLFPLSSISNIKTINCNENGYHAIYFSDRYGFNNPNYEWDKKEIEYLLVGDSYTHGACVNRPDDIASVLRLLSNKSVLNLGYGGNGPLIEHAVLREYLISNIKKVLWIYYEGNDLKDLNYELNNTILKNYLNNASFKQNLISKQDEINEIANSIILSELRKQNKEIEKVWSKKNLINFLKLNKLRSFINDNYLPEEFRPLYSNHDVKKTFKKILSMTKKLTNENNSELYFVYLPSYSRYKTKNSDTNYKQVIKIVNDLDIPIIDIHKKVFKRIEDPLSLFPFKLYGHYNVEGYRRVAETIFEYTQK